MTFTLRSALTAALVATTLSPPAHAVEGGIGAYFMGTRDTFAGIVPPPGTYYAFTYDNLQGTVSGVSIGGLPIAADADVSLSLHRLGITRSFDTGFLGGRPALNVTIPVPDVGLSFTAVTAPIEGIAVDDTTSGLGDISATPIVGWSRGLLSYSAALTIYAPTGSYATAQVDPGDRSVDLLSNGKNVWSFQPVIAATWLDPQTGLELSGAASMLLSTKNGATDYQTAPAVQLEGAILQHGGAGWAFGVTGYHYEQIEDDSGAGAESTREFLGASSLRARVSGAGPIVTWSGASLLGQQTSFRLKYVSEFNARRRLESDVWTLSMGLAF